MKSFYSDGDHFRADLAPESQDSASSQRDLASSLCRESFRYPHIAKLANKVQQGDTSHLLARPLEINALEMLEAELANQRITSLRPRKSPQPEHESALCTRAESCTSLAQRASLEATVWRWRARRLSIDVSGISFAVNIRLFLLSWAAELENALDEISTDHERVVFIRKPQLSSASSDNRGLVRQKLTYLDEIAAFLNGDVRRRAHPFDRGLDVILKVLSAPQESTCYSPNSIEPLYNAREESDRKLRMRLCLPLSRSDFFSKLRSFTTPA